MIIWNLNLVTTFFLIGLIWIIQLVQYPGFLKVPPGQFPVFHNHHCRAITRVVLPAMGGQCLLALFLLLPGLGKGVPGFLVWLNLLLVLITWVSTIWIQAPLHGRLATFGWDDERIRTLIRSNWIRTAAWTLQGGLLFYFIRN